MFDWYFIHRAKVAAEHVQTGLLTDLQQMSAIDRAATIAVINGLINAAGATWGKDAKAAPDRLKKGVIAQVICHLSNSHKSLVSTVLPKMQGRSMNEVTYSQTMRQLRAYELLMVTYGCYLNGEPRSSYINSCWKLLLADRIHVNEAVAMMYRYLEHTGVWPVLAKQTNNQQKTKESFYRLIVTLPPFLKAKSTRPQSQKS